MAWLPQQDSSSGDLTVRETVCLGRLPYTGLWGKLGRALIGETNPSIQTVPTTGSILVLNFAEVVQLTAELYAPGSLGSSLCNYK